MKLKLKDTKLTDTKLITGNGSFLIGAATMVSWQNLIPKSKPPIDPKSPSANIRTYTMDALFNQFFNEDFFDQAEDPFKEMRRMREGMFMQFNPDEGGGLFDS